MRKKRSRRKAQENRIKAINVLRIIVGTILIIYLLYSLARDFGLI